jgi:dipeptidyl aminopeptidase/acylaminoacyl peptidase
MATRTREPADSVPAAPSGRRRTASAKGLDVSTLWQLARLGAPSLSPDGAQAVLPVTRSDLEADTSTTTLWLLSTLGGAPRPLTTAGTKDGQPRWSPRGDRIAFVAKREQEGGKDDEPQLYVIAPDGGEARRVTRLATGVGAFRWLPDGRRIVFVSWVRPGLRGTAAQEKAHLAFKARKETGYVSSEPMIRHWDHAIPMDRVPHLHLLDVDTGRVRDLFEGTDHELDRREPDANTFDVSPDGRRIVFAADPAPVKRGDGRFALVELDLRSGRFATVRQDPDWDFGAPRWRPDGRAVAYLAAHVGRKHTMPAQLAVWWCDEDRHEIVGETWDHEAHAPLAWTDDGLALLCTAEHRGRRHLWRFDVADRRAEIAVTGGWVSAFDLAAGTLVTVGDAAEHPGRCHVHPAGQAPRRLESFNDEVLARVARGRVEEVWFDGAESVPGSGPDPVQMWLHYPPGFDPRRKWPVLHLIHGGPHTAMGDGWHDRWNASVFAAAGYVVAVVNYHGSSGFGQAFKDSITHRWGALELQDIERATDWLLQRRWADSSRIFASGGSYGGYLVAWMNGRLPKGRYAAYVCHAGCWDWRAMFADDAWAWHAKELGAWYWDDPARVEGQSPVAFAAGLTTPTLVIHGALDYRVPDAQGLAYYNTLQARGIPARWLWFPDENHWILKPRNSRQWYGEFLGWLAAHDPAQRPRGRHRP